MSKRVAPLVLSAWIVVGLASIASAGVDRKSAHEIIRGVEAELKAAHRASSADEFHRVHAQIAALVAELRAAYPDDPRVVKFLPERWLSLDLAEKRAEAEKEIREVLATSKDQRLRNDALLYQIYFQCEKENFKPPQLAEVEAFARQAPGDNRAAGLFYEVLLASNRAYAQVGLLAAVAVAGLVVFALAWKRPNLHNPERNRRLGKVVVRLAQAGVLLVVAALVGFRLYFGDRQGEVISTTLGQGQALAASAWESPTAISARRYWDQLPEWIAWFARSNETAWALGFAIAVGLIVVVIRGRKVDAPPSNRALARVWLLGFTATLAAACTFDASWITWRRHQLRERIVRDYPDSHFGRIVQGEERGRDRIGEPFDLTFNDAITGRTVSMADYRGKVVVVDFWATWCGPCVYEIPELIRLHTKYHDQGVEFIGVSHDFSEEDGGLKSLKDFVAEHHIPWPQFHQPRDSDPSWTGAARGDFIEFWGVNGFPTVFLIDKEGKLYSTEARGQLDSLIPRLLKR